MAAAASRKAPLGSELCPRPRLVCLPSRAFRICDLGERRRAIDRFAISLAAWLFLAAALPTASGGQVAAGSAPPLKFVTFNLFHGGVLSGLGGDAKDLDGRLEITGAELRRLGADVVGLQEASTGRGRGSAAARLAAQLGFHHVYAPASSRFFGNNGVDRVIAFLLNFTEGPAILSRFPWQRIEEPIPTVMRRVDYVFVVPGTEFAGRVLSSRVILDAPRQVGDGKVLWPSDHYGILAELDVFPPPAGKQ